MKKQLLVGANTEKELVFADLEIRTWNGYPEFSVSFDTVRPFNKDKIDLEEYAKSWLDELDKGDLYDLCEQYGCSPLALPSQLVENTSIDELMDLSLYDKSIDIYNNEWRFESCCGGQYDTRNNMELYVNEKLYNRIIELWDLYHLKSISEDVQKEIEKIITQLEEIDEEQWIKDYVAINFY